jgi:hypothetical protein
MAKKTLYAEIGLMKCLLDQSVKRANKLIEGYAKGIEALTFSQEKKLH